MKKAVLLSGRIQCWEHCSTTLRGMPDDSMFFVSLNSGDISPYQKRFIDTYNIPLENIHTEVTPTAGSISTEHSYGVTVNAYNLWSMLFHRKKAFEMVPINTECVVIFRADVWSTSPLPIGQIDPNTVYIPEGQDWVGINDQIAYGSYDTMQKYTSLFDNVEDLVLGKGVNYHPETLLAAHIKYQGINIVRFPYSYVLHNGRENITYE